MFLSFYNHNHVGDVLLLLSKETTHPVSYTRVGDVTQIVDTVTNDIVAYNIFNISSYCQIDGNGQIFLNDDQLAIVNQLLVKANFDPITVDNTPKFVIGYVKECQKHPDSDHLHITQVLVDNDETLQIVCGASNVEKDQKVVVAKIGAVMPSGLIIWAGELRGVASHGMLCSARELGLTNDMTKKGILVLKDGTIGQPFFQ